MPLKSNVAAKNGKPQLATEFHAHPLIFKDSTWCIFFPKCHPGVSFSVNLNIWPTFFQRQRQATGAAQQSTNASALPSSSKRTKEELKHSYTLPKQVIN